MASFSRRSRSSSSFMAHLCQRRRGNYVCNWQRRLWDPRGVQNRTHTNIYESRNELAPNSTNSQVKIFFFFHLKHFFLKRLLKLFLIISNNSKQDLPNAFDIDYLNRYFLNSANINNNNNNNNNKVAGTPGQRQVILKSSCAVTGDGLFEALDALYEMILKKHKQSKQSK